MTCDCMAKPPDYGHEESRHTALRIICLPQTIHNRTKSSHDIHVIHVHISHRTTWKVPDKKSSDSDMYGNMTHNQPPSNRALQVRILIPMGASGCSHSITGLARNYFRHMCWSPSATLNLSNWLTTTLYDERCHDRPPRCRYKKHVWAKQLPYAACWNEWSIWYEGKNYDYQWEKRSAVRSHPGSIFLRATSSRIIYDEFHSNHKSQRVRGLQ